MVAAVSTRAPRRTAQGVLKAGMFLVSVLALAAIVSFFRNTGIGELQTARKRVAALHADIARAQAENGRLRAEIESVKRSTYAVERIAREDLGMSRKGEVVYMLPKR